MKERKTIEVNGVELTCSLTTEHPSSSYGQPVLIIEKPDNLAGVVGWGDTIIIGDEAIAGAELYDMLAQ